MNYKQFANKWLSLYDLYNKEADYNGLVGVWLEELASKIMSQGHSATSFAITLSLFDRMSKDYLDPRCDVWRQYYQSEEGQKMLNLYGATYKELCAAVSNDNNTSS